MTHEPDRNDIEAAREDLLDKLAASRQRRKQVAYAVAMGQAEEQALAEADQSVRGIEQKLEGLSFGLERVSAQEKERDDAKAAARRWETAVKLMALVQRRFWATQTLDEALDAACEALGSIEELGHGIELTSFLVFADDPAGEENRSNFLRNVDVSGLADTNNRFHRDIRNGHLRRYSNGLLFARNAALSALATAVPEVVDDPALQKEALERARREQGEAEDTGEAKRAA